MQFKHNGLKFEVSHLDHVVINTVRQVIEEGEATSKGRIVKPPRVTNKFEKVEEPGTRVWVRLKFAKGIRWAKFRHHGTIPDESDLISADAEQWETPQGIQKMIMDAMQRPDIDLWFSGSYCNIRIIQNWQDVQRIRAQEEARRQHRNFRNARRRHDDRVDALRYAIQQNCNFPPSPVLKKIIQDAVQKSAAQLREESISTPFGMVPVMRIRGSDRRKNHGSKN